jgi:riboflavin synthase
MFTGLVERTGTLMEVVQASGSAPARFWIDTGTGFDAADGDSISVNGCCLTVVERKNTRYAFDVSSETIACTSFGRHGAQGSVVNLERALRLGDRLGGHLVSGHVDGTGRVMAMEPSSTGWLFRVHLERSMSRFVISKGSICVDGVSLTVNSVEDVADGTIVEMMIIPATLRITNLSHRKSGDHVNIELDMIAKFAARQTEIRP